MMLAAILEGWDCRAPRSLGVDTVEVEAVQRDSKWFYC